MATVIKAGHMPRTVRRLEAIDLADHVGEARVVMEEAHSQACEIIAEASQRAARDVQQVRQEARDKGYGKGYQEGLVAGRKDGLEEARAEFGQKQSQLVAALQESISKLEAMKEQIRLEAEKDVLDFAVVAATRLTFRVGDLRREAAMDNFRRAMALVTDKTSLTIRCSPKDSESLRKFFDSDFGALANGIHLRFVEDESIQPGGCVIQSGNGEVDASLETQVEQMAAALIGNSADA